MNVKTSFVYLQQIYIKLYGISEKIFKNYLYFYTNISLLVFLFPRFLTSEKGKEFSLNTADAYMN